VPDTASDPPTLATRHRPRLTLRLRLTLLYGACFLVAGVVLLGITYGLVASSTRTVPRFVARARNVTYTTPAPGVVIQAVSGAAGVGGQATPSPATLNQLRASGQQAIKQVVARAQLALVQQHTATLNALLTRSALALVIMALLSVGLGYLLAGRTLRPLRTMNTRARAITEDSLHERLDIGNRSDELGELGSTFDALLARLERAFEAQRRFVANASHELRTPVTLERALVEVALADPHATRDSLRATCERVLAATEHQERVIDALLALARSQAGTERREAVDLGQLCCAALSADMPADIRIEASLEPAPIRGDRPLLERMVANLLDNAVKHNATQGAWITVRTGTRDGVSSLRIANGGAAISPAQAADLFEPFRRLEGERTDAAGLGLGLSIVRGIAHAHGAEVQALPLPGGGLEFDLRFPAAAQARGASQAQPARAPA